MKSSKGQIVKKRTAENTELLTRVGMALSLSASSLDVGADNLKARLEAIGNLALADDATQESKAMLNTVREGLAKSGLINPT